MLKPKTQTWNRWAWLVLPALIFLGIFFVYPLFEILQRSFLEPELGLQNFKRFFDPEKDTFRKVLFNTLKISFLVTAACLLIGYPYAYLMNSSRPRVAGLLLVAVLIPFWSSLLVRTYAWTVILQRNGIVNDLLIWLNLIEKPLRLVRNFNGVVIGMTHILLPFMVLPIYAVMQRIDKDLVTAAESLGAHPIRAFMRVFWPLSLPGVFAGSLLVFIVALGYYITPALLGSPRQMMMGQMVVQQVSEVLNWGMGSALGVVLLVVTLGVLALVGRIVNINEVLLGGGDDE